MRQAANLTAAPLHKLDGNHVTNARVSELNDLTRTQLETLYHDDYALLKACSLGRPGRGQHVGGA